MNERTQKAQLAHNQESSVQSYITQQKTTMNYLQPSLNVFQIDSIGFNALKTSSRQGAVNIFENTLQIVAAAIGNRSTSYIS